MRDKGDFLDLMPGCGHVQVLLCEFVPLCRIGRRLPCQEEGILQTPPNSTSIELQHHLVLVRSEKLVLCH